MKRMILSAALVGAALAPSAQAFTYTDGDVLLAFRELGYNDVVFNLGSVSQFLGMPSGTVKTVTNWNATLTLANFGETLDGASFAVLAVSAPQATASRSWLSDSDTATPTHVTYSKWSTQHGAVAGVGKDAVAMVPAASSAYVRDPGSSHSYTYIVGGGGSYDVATLGGSSAFPVEADILGDGATVRFFEIKADNSSSIPQQIGTFAITADGRLTFTAGSSAIAPTIITPPASQTVNLGAPVSFSVVASGTDPKSYQWRRNGTDLSGKTADTLSIASATSGDSGDYTVVVSNLGGSVTNSPAATLTVRMPATIATAPASQTVNPGASVTFAVVAGGTAPFSYQWRRNGSNLTGKTNDTLNIPSATAADAGDYTVVVTNLAGSATNNPAATLLIRVPATVTGGTWQNGQFKAPVQTLSGLTYTLVYKDTITDATWTPILPATPGTGGIVNLTDPSATGMKRFYRVLTQ